MNTVLSVQGASAPVKKKSFFSKFTRLNMLRLVRAVIPVAVLMMFFPQLALAAQGAGQDLMAKGQETVKATFGKNSSIVKWVTGPCKPHSASGPDVDVSGRAWSLSAFCPGVGAESVPPCAYPATGH